MKIHKQLYLLSGLLALLLLGSHQSLRAQSHGILRMNAVNHATHFNTGIDLQAALSAGIAQEASIEFWVRSTFANNDWQLTDILGNDQSLSLKMTAGNQLVVRLGGTSQTIDLSGTVQASTWHHVTLVYKFQVLQIYINGRKQAEVTANLATTYPRYLYFYRERNQNSLLEIAEVRTWNKARTEDDIDANWLRSFTKLDAVELTNLIDNRGLYMLLGQYEKASVATSVLDSLDTMQWRDALAGSPKMGQGVRSYSYKGIMLMEVRDDIEHPIFLNDKILLKASKGTHPDKVVLTWPHIKGATSYNIFKNDSQIGSVNAGSNVGDNLAFEVKSNILPGETDLYKVKANGEVTSTGLDYGFVFHNGKISGTVASSSKVGTPEAAITLEGDGGLPGHALGLAKNSKPLLVKNVDVFKKSGAASDFMVEFWYKGATTEPNTVFALGNVQVQMQAGNTVEATNGNGTPYLVYTNPAGDDQWHHYAIVWSAIGGRIYIDGALVANNSTAYAYSSIGVLNTWNINASAGTDYALDELRVWGVKRGTVRVDETTHRDETDEEWMASLDKQIHQHYPYVISGNQDTYENLWLYYRFDLDADKETYNQASHTAGRYIATTTDLLNRVATNNAMKYVVYTDDFGNYVMEGLNFGNTSTTFIVAPVKTNHLFNPTAQSILLQSSTQASDYTKSKVDFTDESQFNISGNVFYFQDGVEYPVPAGQTFQSASGANPTPLDYITINSEEGTPVGSDNFGQYNLSLPIGLQHFQVTNREQLRTFGAQSLKFDGVNDFVKSANTFIAPANGATWSGWIKRDDFAEGQVPALQTIMQVGNIRLVLRNNSFLALYDAANASLVELPFGNSTGWQFFAFTYHHTTQTLHLYTGVSNTAASATTIASSELAGFMYLGAEGVNLGENLKAHLHLIEVRDVAYNNAALDDLKAGNYIANDDQHLTHSYAFGENAQSLRVVSNTANSQAHALNLLNDVNDESTMPLFDGSVANPYTRKYKYEYEAQGAFAQEAKQVWNVTQPESSINFYNHTRYGITGNIIIPCNNSIGLWDVTVERTDVTSPTFSKTFTAGTTPSVSDVFNSEGTVFTVNDLLPGIYKVTLTNQADPTIVKTQFGVDITKGWSTVDIEYRSPLQVTTSVVEILDKTQGWIAFDATSATNYCANENRFILEQQQQYRVRLEFFEQYGDSKCYSANTDYYVSGDLPQYHGKGEVVGSSSDAPFTSATGIDTVAVWTAYPNFAGEHTRQLTVNATNRPATASLTAWIVGTVQDENQTFTLTFPNVKQVLYDPPGDGSSITWGKGATVNSSSSLINTGSVKLATKITSGVKHSAYMGAWFGMGGGSVVLYESSTGEVSAGGAIAENISIGGGKVTTNALSFNTNITTPEGTSPLPGEQSDMFFGTSDIMYMGTGKTISVVDCKAANSNNDPTISVETGASFVFTRFAIEKNLIPNLRTLVTSLRAGLNDTDAENKNRESLSANDRGKVDTIKNRLGDIRKWQEVLNKTVANRDQVFQGTNNDPFTMQNDAGTKSLPAGPVALSGQTNLEYAIGKNTTTSKVINVTNTLDFTKYFKTNATVFSVKYNLESEISLSHEIDSQTSSGNENKEAFTINLFDDDAKDQFSVRFRQDPDYPTPIIVARAGESMCPVEKHTVARQGVQLTVDNSTAWADLNGVAYFDVTMSNVQPKDEASAKNYIIRIPSEHLPVGIEIKVENLADAVLTSNGYVFNIKPGESKHIRIEAYRRGDNAPVEFKNIPLTFFSACDESLLNFYGGEKVQTGTDAVGNPVYAYEKGSDKKALVYNSDGTEYVKLRDVVKLNVNFHAPCAGNIEVAAPATSWVVNSTSKNILPFKFKPVTPHATFAKVRLEFALVSSDEIQFAKEVTLTELGTPDAQGYYTYNLSTIAIGADQAYRARVVPICGSALEDWEVNNPSDWITGNIQRANPTIIEVSPLNGSTAASALATATYNKPLNANGVNPLSVSLRGILGSVKYVPTSALFDQVADQITIPDQNVLDLDSSYTVEFWAKPDKVHSNILSTPIISKGTNLNISFIQGNKIYAGQGAAFTDESLDTDGWTHVAVVFIKGEVVNTLKIYLNGTLAKSVSAGIQHFAVNANDLVIAQANSTEGFKGGLDEIRIWNKALLEANIRTNMKKRLIGTEEGLQAYYVLDNIAPDGEAIRDFTGKTKGTTSDGITFITKDQAAPLDVETIVHDIPVAVSTSADLTKVIVQPVATFAPELLEGALLTAVINDGAIKDAFGNPAAGKSWAFRVDGNNVGWNQANYTVVQTTGTSQSFDLSLVSTNAAEVQYQLTEVPMWLNITNNAALANGVYILPGGHTHAMSFATAPWLSAGTYYGQVKAKITQGANLLGYETLDLKVIVSCDDRHLTITPADFTFNMSTQLTIQKAGQVYTDATGKTLLVRNSKGTLVGKGIVQAVGNAAVASLNIYSNEQTPVNPTCTVYLWDGTACQENPIGTVEFANGVTLNTTLDADYSGKAQYTINLLGKNHWLSFRATNVPGGKTLSLNQVTGFQANDAIQTQGMDALVEAIYDGTQWKDAGGNVLTNFSLDVTKSYLVTCHNGGSRTLQVAGYQADRSQTIDLVANPDNGNDTDNNALGYTRTDAIAVVQAMGRLNPDPSIGDVVVSKEGLAQYTLVNGTGTWVGSLTHLIPNQGYKIKVANTSTLKYSSTSGIVLRTSTQVAAPVKAVVTDAQRLHLSVNAGDYKYSSHVIGVLQSAENLKNEQDYMVVAFAGNEARGVAIPQQIEGKWYYFLTAYTNQTGEQLDFQLVARANGDAYALENVMGLTPSALQGKVADPYVFRLRKDASAATQTGEVGLQLFQNQPNPTHDQTTIAYYLPESGQVSLTVTNSLGQTVQTLVNGIVPKGHHQVMWNLKNLAGERVPKGTYLYTLKTTQGVLTKRLVIQ
ncbi:LamG-like jellyroll fold domain-containing protein [uncultured Microscilla sp.]|uniref:LamG-like jellyroll fold domain-containing protein n=1 Tax=uncultured Microscilla sp. TaxID=432653 RepID=UPI0026174E5F|nr:LamG-like jellyroll fold domain-containing protein [uncultured Microscilla sp.]